VLFVGNLLPVKGPDVLVDACDRLARRGVRFQCQLIGQGSMRGAVERQIGDRGLADWVKLVGSRPLEELPAWYRRASVLVLPSYSEGVPNVLLEALASGTPVVVSASSALREIVRPGCGAAVEDHAPAFAEAVTGLLDSPEELRRAAARARAEEFTWPAAVAGMLATFT